MELEKNYIHMNNIVKSEVASIHLAENGFITEDNPEVMSIINQKEKVTVDSVEVRNNQVVISGTLSYSILYYGSDNCMVYGVENEIPFEEIIKVNGVDDSNNAKVKMSVLTSNIKMVDRRNYIYKVSISAYVTVEKLEDIQVVTDANDTGIMKRFKTVEPVSLVGERRETIQIQDEIEIPSNKPPIEKIVWQDVRIKNVNTKVLEGAINVSGEMSVFVMYIPDEEGMPQQWNEGTIKFSENIEMNEATEDMVAYTNVEISNINTNLEMNLDNENRIIDMSIMLVANVELYEERKMQVLEDVYSPGINLVPDEKEVCYKKLLVKNASRTKVSVKMNIGEKDRDIMQICNSKAALKIDKITVDDSGIKTTGKIKTTVMYISSQDNRPVCVAMKEENFEHRIDAEGISNDDKYYINWRIEQISENMINSEEVEVKAVIVLEAIVFKNIRETMLEEITEQPIDMEKYSNAPILKGYIVKKGDTLWKLAKENYTTVEKIMKINELKDDKIMAGDKLLILKSCQL